MLFLLILIVLGMLLAPVLQRQFQRRWGLTFWEADWFAFGIVFFVSSFLPKLGVPFVHPRTGESLIENSLIAEFVLLSGICYLLGIVLVLRRRTKNIVSVPDNHTTNDSSSMEGCKNRLRVISDYGQAERIVTEEPTEEDIRSLMNSLDWNEFHQVVIDRGNGDWMEVGGSLDPGIGLSAMFSEGNRQSVIVEPLKDVGDMNSILLMYLASDGDWKRKWEWECPV